MSAPHETPGQPETCLDCGKVRELHDWAFGIGYCHPFTIALKGDAAVMKWRTPTPEQRELARLRSLVHRLEGERDREAARLDWLESTMKESRRGVALDVVDVNGADRVRLWEPLDDEIPDGWCHARNAESLRAAIDAARLTPQDTTDATPEEAP